jgi:hypothetical protein
MVTSIGATANRSKELKKAASCRRGSPPCDPFGAHSVLPPASPTRPLLGTRHAQHRVPPHPITQHLRAPGNPEQPCATRSHPAGPGCPSTK